MSINAEDRDMDTPTAAPPVSLRQFTVSLLGEFGAYPSSRLNQLIKIVSPMYPERPEVNFGVAGVGIQIPGMNMFAGPSGALVVGAASWVVSNNATAAPNLADVITMFASAVDAGLAPEVIAYNAQIAYGIALPGAASKLYRRLPWGEVPKATHIGAGSRNVFRDSDGTGVDLTVESDFTNHDNLIAVAKLNIEHVLPYEDVFRRLSHSLDAVRDLYVPLMLQVATG